jgi:hypothetical protein
MTVAKLIKQNMAPISYIAANTCIGYLLGHADIGFVSGVLAVCLVSLFYTGLRK